MVKEFKPALDLTVSNPTRLKLGLWIFSQTPKNSTVFLFLSQLITTNRGSSAFFFLAISVKHTYFCKSISLIPIPIPSTLMSVFFSTFILSTQYSPDFSLFLHQVSFLLSSALKVQQLIVSFSLQMLRRLLLLLGFQRIFQELG